MALTIPILVLLFDRINKHYEAVAQTLSTRGFPETDIKDVANVAIIPIADVHRGTLRALQYAKRIATDVRAICVTTSDEMRERVERRWARFPNLTQGIQLVLIEYDYRDILTPLVEYIEKTNVAEFPNQMVTVVIPEFVPLEGYARVLHNQTANILRQRLRSQEEVVVIDVPYHIPPVEELRMQPTQVADVKNEVAAQSPVPQRTGS